MYTVHPSEDFTYQNGPLIASQEGSPQALDHQVRDDLATSPAYMALRQPSQSLPASSVHAARPPLYETEDSSKPPDYLTSNLQTIYQRSLPNSENPTTAQARYYGSAQPDTRRGHPSTRSQAGRYDNYWENIESQRGITSDTLRRQRCTRRKKVYAMLLALTIVILVLCLTTTIRWRARGEEEGDGD